MIEIQFNNLLLHRLACLWPDTVEQKYRTLSYYKVKILRVANRDEVTLVIRDTSAWLFSFQKDNGIIIFFLKILHQYVFACCSNCCAIL